MTTEEIFRWIEDNYGLIVACVDRSKVARNPDEFDELLSECIDKIPQICNSYIPTMGAKLSTHVFANLKWYIYKWQHKKAWRRWEKHSHLGAKPEGYVIDFWNETYEEINRRIEELVPCKQTRWLITAVCSGELGITKCAEHLGLTYDETYKLYRDAMILLKQELCEDDLSR